MSNYDKDKPKPNWYNRVAVGSIGLASIGVVAYKMGGPTGRLLDNIRDELVEKDAADKYLKWSRKSVAPEDVKDLQAKIVTSSRGDTMLAGGPPTDEMMNEAIDKEFKRHQITDDQLFNKAARMEADIEAAFNQDIHGHATDKLMKLKEFRRYHKAPTDAEMRRDMVVSKLKHQTITDYHRTSYVGMEGVPDIDLTDPDIVRDPFAKSEEIDKLHQHYMKNDKVYARKYNKALHASLKEIKISTATSTIANPTLQKNGIFGTNSVPKSMGSVKNMWSSILDIEGANAYTLEPDKSVMLHITGQAGFSSDEIVAKPTSFELKMDNSTRIKYQKYMPQLKRIQGRLEEIQTQLHGRRGSHVISDIQISDQVYSVGSNRQVSYAVVEWDVNVGTTKKHVTIPIPMAENNTVPSIKGINGRLRANVNYVSANPFGLGSRQVVNTTQMAFEELHNSLTSSMMNEMEVDTSKFQRRIVDRISNRIENGVKPLANETRDFFSAHQVKVITNDTIMKRKGESRKGFFKQLRSGGKSLRNMQLIKNNPHEYVTMFLDIETINLMTNSPQLQKGDPFTGIWQYGIVEQDMGTGNIRRVKQIASDHVLNEQYMLIDKHIKDGTLKNALKDNGNTGKNLRSMAEYAQRTVGGSDDLDALLRMREMIKAQANVDNRYVNSLYKNPIRTSNDFARVIDSELRNAQMRAAKEGKKLIIGTANGDFDLSIIGNLLGDSAYASKFDHLDVQTMTRAMTLGLYDQPAMSAENLMPWYASKTGRPGLSMLSLSKDPVGTVKAISTGVTPTAHVGTRRALDMMVNGELSKYGKWAIAAGHSSSVYDNVNALGIMHMQMEFFEKDGFQTARNIEDFVQNASGYDVNKNLKSHLELELGRLPGQQQWFSYGLMSSNAASKKIGSMVHIAHMWPGLSLNPGNKDLHQFARHDMVRKDTIKNPHREYMMKNPLRSNVVTKVEHWMTRVSDFDMRYYANELQFNMAYAVNMTGSKNGLFKTAADTLDFTVHSTTSVRAGDLPADSKLANELTNIYSKITKKVKDLSKTLHGDPNHTISGEMWKEACSLVLAKEGVTLPTFTRDANVPMKVSIGGEDHVFNSQLNGRVTSLRVDGRPGEKGTPGFIADIMFEASGNDLNNAAVNHMGTKSIVTRLNVKSAELAYGKFNVLPDNYAIMNFDFLDKKYWGSMKEMMIRKGLGVSMYNAKHAATAEQRAYAVKSYKRIANLIRGSFPVTQNKDGSVRFGPRNLSEDPKEIMKKMSAIRMNDIVYELGAVGHEASWTRKTMESYYNLRGGGDMWRGRDKIRNEVADLLLGLDSAASKIEKRTQQVMTTADQRTLIKLLDPLGMIEDNLRQRDELVGGSIESHYKTLTRDKQEQLIKGARITPFLQELPDLQGGGSFLGFYGGYQPSAIYNNNAGRDIKYMHDVKWQKSYFEQTHVKDSLFSTRTRRLLRSSMGYRRPGSGGSKQLDVAKKFFRLSEAIQNKGVADLASEHMLTLDNIDAIIHRRTTMKAFERDLESLADNKNTHEIAAISDSLDDMLKDVNKAESINKDAVAHSIFQKTTGERREILETVAKRNNYLHQTEIQEWADLAVKKKDIFFLPSKFKHKDKIYGNERLTITLEDAAEAFNKKVLPTEPLDSNAFLSMLRLVQKGEKYKTLSKTNQQLFDIVDLGNGKHEIHLGGFLMPAHGHVGNIADMMDSQQYGIGTQTTKMSFDMMEGYYMYAKDMIEGRTDNLGAHSTRLFTDQMKMYTHALSMDKMSAMFKSTQTGVMQGFQAVYKSVDTHIASAHQVIQDIASDAPYIKKWFATNKQWTKKDVTGVLNRFTQMKLNTMTAMTSTLFDEKQVAVNFTTGKQEMIADMIQKGTKEFQEMVAEMKLGRRTLPGGVAVRFPMLPNGVNPGFEGPLFAMPDEIGTGLLGMSNNHMYMVEPIGELVKADNDVDLMAVVMKSFSTIEDIDRASSESRYSLNKLMSRLQGGGYQKAYNDANYVLSTYYDKGERMARVSKLDSSGKFVVNKVRYDALDFVSNAQGMVRETGKLGGALAPLSSTEFVARSNLHTSTKALGDHIATSAMGGFSKNQIGLWTNTIQKKVHELFMANGAMATKSTVLMDMIGDLNHGLASIAQSPIKATKHGDLESVMDMTKMLSWITNPTKSRVEDYNMAYSTWVDQFPVEKQEAMGDIFRVWTKRSSVFSLLDKYDPEAAKFAQREQGIMMGKQGTNFMDYVSYKMIGESKVQAKLDNAWRMAYENVMNLNDKMRGGINPKDAQQAWATKLQRELAETSLDKRFNEVFGDAITKAKFGIKRGGKGAAIAGLAFLALNMFRPNQMSSSSNPLDAFVDLGIDIHGNNSTNELQLGKEVPLDLVNASFSKKAFIEMQNNNSATIKRAQGNMGMDAIKSRYMTPTMVHSQFNSGGSTTYSNLTSNIGIFGSGETQRRARRIGSI